MNRSILIATSLLIWHLGSAQIAPGIEWQYAYGGTADDTGWSIVQTNDGGYIVAASSASNISIGNHGGLDIWILKLGADGSMQWQTMLGGAEDDFPKNMIQTTEGDYVVVGHTTSTDGNVSGYHGYGDGWIAKLDPLGSILWQRCLGGSDADNACDILQTSDGFVILGQTRSIDGDVSAINGLDDIWLIKLGNAGELIWEHTYGGSSFDHSAAIVDALDGGWVIAGASMSDDGDITGNNGADDYWILKVDADGQLQWQASYGGSNSDRPRDVVRTSDGGYGIIGQTSSDDGDISASHGYTECWLVKVDSVGALLWQKALGGSAGDGGSSITSGPNGDMVLAGGSASSNGDIASTHGGNDVWVIRVDQSGDIVWERCYGGTAGDVGQALAQTVDGGYVFTGNSASSDGDLSQNSGVFDCWVVKLATDVSAVQTIEHTTGHLMIAPNPVSDVLHFEFNERHSEWLDLIIVNASGSIVHSGRRLCSGTGCSFDLPIQSLASGTYELRVRANGAVFSKPFVKR